MIDLPAKRFYSSWSICDRSKLIYLKTNDKNGVRIDSFLSRVMVKRFLYVKPICPMKC